MGTFFALTFVALTMGYHEVKLYIIIKNKFTRPVSDCFERSSKRFLNDCFIRNSRPEVFCKKDVLGNFAKFIGK